VFSFLLGDNPVFRFISALFIGVTAGYFLVVILYQVILARLVAPLLQGSLITLIPLALSGLLLTKLSPRLTKAGNTSMALLVGVGAAVAIGGAVLGTIIGQIKGALFYFGPQTNGEPATLVLILEGVFFLIGTLAALAYFNFGATDKKNTGPRRTILVAIFAWIGKIFIAITLGAVFAGVLTAGMTALVERSDFIIRTIYSIIR
jgi:hypothetical protein